MRRHLLAASALAMLLAVPAYAQTEQHEQHHPGETPASMPGPTGAGMMGMMGGAGMMGQGCSSGALLGSLNAKDKNLSVDEAKAIIAGDVAATGNKRLKVGKVTEQDKDSVLAEVVTTDNSLVQKILVDRHSGAVRSAE